MESKKFLKSASGTVMLVVWALIGLWTAVFLFDLGSKYAEFTEHKKQQEEIVKIITSVTDEYNKYAYMSEEMVSAIESDYCSSYYIGSNKTESMKKAEEKANVARKTARQTVADMMKNKGYSGFTEANVERCLREYSFLEFDHDEHIDTGIITAVCLVVSSILNIVLYSSFDKTKKLYDNEFQADSQN